MLFLTQNHFLVLRWPKWWRPSWGLPAQVSWFLSYSNDNPMHFIQVEITLDSCCSVSFRTNWNILLLIDHRVWSSGRINQFSNLNILIHLSIQIWPIQVKFSCHNLDVISHNNLLHCLHMGSCFAGHFQWGPVTILIEILRLFVILPVLKILLLHFHWKWYCVNVDSVLKASV